MDIVVAQDFPKDDYLGVEQHISEYLSRPGKDAGTVPGFPGYAGGWNALVMRFRAADEDKSVASSSLARPQGSLSAEDRYVQERALFGFFANAMSAVESCCFAIYHLGRMKVPTQFGLPDDKITVGTATVATRTWMPHTQLDAELSKLRGDSTWLSIKGLRNTLVHRESPGITIYVGMAGGAPPRPAEWTGRGVSLEPLLVEGPRAWLGDVIGNLVRATLDFVRNNF